MITSKYHSGLVVYWSLSASFDAEKLKRGWTQAEFAHALPEKREPTSVLRDALAEVFGGNRYLIRPLSTRNGFTVVGEERGENENTFTTILTAKVFGAEMPSITGDQSKTLEILDAFIKHSGRVTSQQVSSALVRILQDLGGTCLRNNGGLYWLEGRQASRWEAVTNAVEEAADGKATTYAISHELDARSIEAVRDAIVSEVTSQSKRLMDEIVHGDLGERAIKSRKLQAAELKRKTEHYEAVLGVTLTHLKAALEEIEQSNACAALLLAANPFEQAESEVTNVASM